MGRTVKAVSCIHPAKNRRAVCATCGPSAGAVDVTPCTCRHCCADRGPGYATYRRKDDPPVWIGRGSAFRAFVTVYVAPYDMISDQPNHEAAACSKARANQRVSHPVVLPYLLGNAKDVFAGQRLLARCLPKRKSVVAQRLELTLVGFDVVHYHANFLIPRQGFEIVLTAWSPLGILTARRPGAEAGCHKRQHQKSSR